MKAVVFGGAGVIGSCSVDYLSKLDTFSEIVIADINEKGAKEIIKNNEKLDFIKIDARDDKSLSKSLIDADVAVNCIGPFYKFAPFIIRAAINKGVNYVDVCDDYDTTEILLNQYHKAAIDANVTCVKGSFLPVEFRDALINLESLGLISENKIKVRDKSIKIIDFTAAYIDELRKKISNNYKKITEGGSIMVEISGFDGSEQKTIKYSGTANMQQGTGTPAAIGSKMIIEGDVSVKGVHAPEGCIPPEKFIMNFFGAEGFGDVWISFTHKMSGELI